MKSMLMKTAIPPYMEEAEKFIYKLYVSWSEPYGTKEVLFFEAEKEELVKAQELVLLKLSSTGGSGINTRIEKESLGVFWRRRDE